MEVNVKKLSSRSKTEGRRFLDLNDDNELDDSKIVIQKNVKEKNSWDSSSSTAKSKNSDWDSSTACHETLVEPFDNNDNKITNDFDNDNSDSESQNKKNNVTGIRSLKTCTASSKDSIDVSFSFSDSSRKSSLGDAFNFLRNPKTEKKYPLKRSRNLSKDDGLLVEDMEEFTTDENALKIKPEEQHSVNTITKFCLDIDADKTDSIKTEEDDTIWIIPESERSQTSTGSINHFISSSDADKIKKIDKPKKYIKKAKSYSDTQKLKQSRKRLSKSTWSACFGNSDVNKIIDTNFLLKCEGLKHKKLDPQLKSSSNKDISGENFDETRVYFTEYECRAMTMDKDLPDRMNASPRNMFNSTDDVFSEPVNENANNAIGTVNEASRNSDGAINNLVLPGPSCPPSLDVVSLPDMTGKNSKKRPLKEKNVRRINSSYKGRNNETDAGIQMGNDTKTGNESWFLLDETGQYQAVTRNEVSILLNGKSADAVLMGKKEHVIPNPNFSDATSLQGSLSGAITKESLQYFLREEDIGGEDDVRKLIDLERKVENTLLCIQPGTNLTASIRIISVDTEMIHIWRRTRDNGSLLSSEVDLRLHSSQGSVENFGQNNAVDQQPTFTNRMTLENHQRPVPEQDEARPPQIHNRPTPLAHHHHHHHNHEKKRNDYSNLLIETRMIVDSLTNNFKLLQSRLDGETNRNVVLQEEVHKLRQMLKDFGGEEIDEMDKRISMNDDVIRPSISLGTFTKTNSKCFQKETSHCGSGKGNTSRAGMNLCTNTLTLNESQDEMVCKSPSTSQYITVDIYTMESLSSMGVNTVQKSSSLVQENLGLIENKMRLLQKENEVITKQNLELKMKLEEISLELEKYAAGTSKADAYIEDDKELDMLRNQVCNLKLELDNLQKTTMTPKNHLKSENVFLHEEFQNKFVLIEKWFETAGQIIQEIQNSQIKLQEFGIVINFTEKEITVEPNNFQKVLNSYIKKITESLIRIYSENLLYEHTVKELKESFQKHQESKKEKLNLDHNELMKQCREGSKIAETDNKIMDDYLAVIIEKASLTEEIKILKTENEILLESQQENFEKLKQTMIALNDRKNEVSALESSQMLSQAEKSKMTDVLKISQEEIKALHDEISRKSKMVEELTTEYKNKEKLIRSGNEKLSEAVNDIKKLEKSIKLKDDLISELKMENNQLLREEEIKSNEIVILSDKLKDLQMQRNQLDSELTSTKLYLNETQKEMSEYISHLETVVHNNQETLENSKQKLKESHQTISYLKNENHVINKQHNCDLKVYSKTKDELDTCKEELSNINDKIKNLNEENKKLCRNLEILENSEKEKVEELNEATIQIKAMLEENNFLKNKLEMFSKDKDESLKEQKDLINRYAILSKEVKKLQEKYRSVKAECNQRTDLVKYLEMLLKENMLEYNSRLACLERSISHILEKIAACKNCMTEKHFGSDAEVKELRQQLNVTYKERRELEKALNNYYMIMKHLETKIQEREKEVDELNQKLSFEEQKDMYNQSAKNSMGNTVEVTKQHYDPLAVEKLESRILCAENELMESKRQLQQNKLTHENEKKKLELVIVDLRSEISRYQMRIEVMMKNLSNCNKNINLLPLDKSKSSCDIEKQMLALKQEVEEKNKKIIELNESVHKYKEELRIKESDLENFKTKNACLYDELQAVKIEFLKMQNDVSNTNKNCEIHEKHKNEMEEKLFQTIKLIMEERSTRQSIELRTAEKLKSLKENFLQIKRKLLQKNKELEALSATLDNKNLVIKKFQDSIKTMSSEITLLKTQILKKKSLVKRGHWTMSSQQPMSDSNLLKLSQPENQSSKRVETCLNELKEVRELNLELRKAEGQYQAKVVCLEEEIRSARLLIKELQGDIKTEKKSKKVLKKMITSAKMEVEKCLLAKLIVPTTADKITRHLDVSKIQSRQLLSDIRINDASDSSE